MNTSSSGSSRLQFAILIATIVAAGLSQGLLLPLLTVILEEMGIPSHLNGLNAGMLYIGTFAMMLFVEPLLGRLGYKKLLSSGLIVVLIALVLFPLFPNLWVWFLLRFAVGMGDSALHYATQLWVITSSPADQRGRNISLYGMSYGLGFSLGPLGMTLKPYGEWVPFAAIAFCFLIVLWLVVTFLPNRRAEKPATGATAERRYAKAFRWAWFALMPAFLYGYTEASMNTSFPLYALKIGIDAHWISFMLPFFGIGGLLLQLPLGILSDRYERKNVLMAAGFIGGIAFLAIPAAGASVWGIALLFAVAGGMLGSFYSLGLAYVADILPKELLPTANVIATYLFSIASIIGPNLGGLGIHYVSAQSMFWALGGLFLLFTLLGFAYRQKHAAQR
ncbi:MFS transporter [Paenibacillus sp. MSJ-34]|uniref:MFS transporter n=1 Tax=Paenibacillus sp. MSJ-34 TaxID=2841529 RepID=UPI001C0F55D1|nr:MFS transporter [Paenibacillus sp. MSJ-34]MBU5445431.1 MFS transporter [Paenibacillus sp. MSJ-34]